MSAFMVSREHINTLVAVAAAWGIYMPLPGVPGKYLPVAGNEQHAGRLLHNANMASLEERYNNLDEEEATPYGGYSEPVHDLPPLAIIKACHCYGYRACEADDYERGDAAELVHRIESAAAGRLPGYDSAAGWGIEARDLVSA